MAPAILAKPGASFIPANDLTPSAILFMRSPIPCSAAIPLATAGLDVTFIPHHFLSTVTTMSLPIAASGSFIALNIAVIFSPAALKCAGDS